MRQNIDTDAVMRQALDVLKNGGVIVYPTDTIWGIGCDATNPAAVQKVYEIKHRADSKVPPVWTWWAAM